MTGRIQKRAAYPLFYFSMFLVMSHESRVGGLAAAHRLGLLS